MDSKRWEKIQALFDAALKQAPQDRSSFLSAASGEDAGVVAEVESLLKADQQTQGFLPSLKAGMSMLASNYTVGVEVGPYKIKELLGRGAMGVVYRAVDSRLGRDVVLKFLSGHLASAPNAKARFLQEARAASVLDHPNICTVYDIDETSVGDVFIVMAFCEGENLETLNAQRALTPEQAVQIAVKVADALRTAHAKRIFHRDVKPANIIVSHNGQVRIVDFGIAKVAGENLTGSGVRLGTLAYMAPEQLTGKSVDHRADIWALGVILYEMLAGERPFGGGNAEAMLYAVLHSSPTALSQLRGLPKRVDQILEQALNVDVEKRFDSMSTMLADLERLQAELPAVSQVRFDASKASSQRRQVTVLNCQLLTNQKGPSEDPEILLSILPDYRSFCDRIITRFGGQILSADSASLIVCFGYPKAYEDAAARAVRTAIGISEAISTWARKQLNTKQLSVRVGVHSGIVITRTDGETGDLVGAVPQIARRLAEMAHAGQVIISEATYRLVELDFSCNALAESIDETNGCLFEVARENAARSRLEAITAKSRTPLIGRDQELSLLEARWFQVVDGIGQCVLVHGEAGIGKSRVVQALKENVASKSGTWLLECHCLPYEQNTAFYPIAEYIRRIILDVGNEQTQSDCLDRLEGFLAQYGLSIETNAPLLCSLLEIEEQDRYEELNYSPDLRKQKTIELLCDLVMTRAERQPLLWVFEDLHWADASTLEFVAAIVEQIPAVPILAVFTCRHGFEASWLNRSQVSHFSLGRLANKQVEQLVKSVAGEHQISQQAIQSLCIYADGVPLYAEELTKAVVVSNDVDTTGFKEIPGTLQDSLAARLDHLEDAKPLAQLAATLGREFSFALAQAVSGYGDARLQMELDQLVTAELLYQRGKPPRATYVFKHALIQEAAYESLIKQDRESLHQRIVAVLKRDFGDVCQEKPQLLARHCTAARIMDEAVDLWQQAGDKALEKSAYLEATGHYQQALDALATLPSGEQRLHRELKIDLSRVMATRAIKGWTSPDVEKLYFKALEISQQLNADQDQATVLFGLWVFNLIKLELEESRKAAESSLRIAEKLKDLDISVQAKVTLGNTLFWMGDMQQAKVYLGNIYEQVHHERAREHIQRYGQDPRVIALMLLGIIHWQNGRPKQAYEDLDNTLKVAEALDHPFSKAIALQAAAWICHHLDDVVSTHKHAENLIQLSQKFGFPFYEAVGLMFLGWCKVRQGDAEGIDQICDGYENRISASGGKVFHSLYIWLLAEAHISGERYSEALEVLSLGLRVAVDKHERIYQVELLRLRAICYLRSNQQEQAKHDINDAVVRAAESGAVMPVLKLLKMLVDVQDFTPSATFVEQAQQVLEAAPAGVETEVRAQFVAVLDQLK